MLPADLEGHMHKGNQAKSSTDNEDTEKNGKGEAVDFGSWTIPEATDSDRRAWNPQGEMTHGH